MTGPMLILPAIFVLIAVYALVLVIYDIARGGLTADEERGES